MTQSASRRFLVWNVSGPAKFWDSSCPTTSSQHPQKNLVSNGHGVRKMSAIKNLLVGKNFTRENYLRDSLRGMFQHPCPLELWSLQVPLAIPRPSSCSAHGSEITGEVYPKCWYKLITQFPCLSRYASSSSQFRFCSLVAHSVFRLKNISQQSKSYCRTPTGPFWYAADFSSPSSVCWLRIRCIRRLVSPSVLRGSVWHWLILCFKCMKHEVDYRVVCLVMGSSTALHRQLEFLSHENASSHLETRYSSSFRPRPAISYAEAKYQ